MLETAKLNTQSLRLGQIHLNLTEKTFWETESSSILQQNSKWLLRSQIKEEGFGLLEIFADRLGRKVGKAPHFYVKKNTLQIFIEDKAIQSIIGLKSTKI